MTNRVLDILGLVLREESTRSIVSLNAYLVLLKSLHSWVSQGVHLSDIFENRKELLDKLILPALLSKQQHLILEAFGVIKQLTGTQSVPRSVTYDAALTYVCEHIIAAFPMFSDILINEDGTSVPCEIVDTMFSFFSSILEFISNPFTFQRGIFDITFYLLKASKNYAHLSFDIWTELQDIPITNRHIYLKSEIFMNLVNLLVDICSYASVEDGDDDEDFLSLRDHRQGIQEIIIISVYACQDSFLPLLSEKLRDAQDWQSIEATIFVLTLSMTALKDSSDHSHGMESFFTNIFSFLFSSHIRTIQSHRPLIETMCKFIGASTFLLTNANAASPLRTFFEPCIQYIYTIVSTPEISCLHAARSFLQLSVHGTYQLFECIDASGKALITSIVLGFEDLISRNLARDNMITVIEAIIRSITKLEPTAALRHMTEVANAMNRSFSRLLGSDPQLIGNLLQYAGIIVRFSDCGNDVNSSQMLGGFLTTIWPMLHVIEEDARLVGNIVVYEEVFDFYTRVIATDGNLVITEVPRIAGLVISAFTVTNNGQVLRCVGAMVEFLSADSSIDTLLRTTLDHLLNLIVERFSLSVYSPESVDEIFSLIHKVLVRRPRIFEGSVNFTGVGSLIVTGLQIYAERTVLRSILNVCQIIFSPSHTILIETKYVLIPIISKFGKDVFLVLLSLIDGKSQSSLWPNIIDALYCVLFGMIETFASDSQCKEWFYVFFSRLDNMRNVPTTYRQCLFDSTFKCLVDDRRKFRMMWLDIAKVCNSEASPDSLGLYHC